MHTAIQSSKWDKNERGLVAAIMDCIIASCFGLCSVLLLWWITLWMKVSNDWCCACNVLWFWVCGTVIYHCPNVLPYDACCCLHNPFPFILFTTAPVSVPPVMEDLVTALMECEDTWFSRHTGYSYFIAIVILELPLEMFCAVTITTRHKITHGF